MGKIKVKLNKGELRLAASALVDVGEMPLPVPIAEKISRMMRAVRGPNDDIEAARLQLLAEHAARDASGAYVLDGKAVVFKDPKAFSDAWTKLTDEMTELPAVDILTPQEIDYKTRCPNCGHSQEGGVVKGRILADMGPLMVVKKE